MNHSALKALSTYPSVGGIVYALKNDSIPDKKIALAQKKSGELSALNIALGSSARRHRYTALVLYFLHENFHWIPPLIWTLHWCKLIGPASAWFEYLLQGNSRQSLRTAKNLLNQFFSTSRKDLFILDIGSGIGQLPQQFPVQKGVNWICADKNFFSLFLAQLYFSRPDIHYVCADLELQRLFDPNTFSAAVCIDCFDFIFQKDVFLEQTAKSLKSPGQFLMINLHEEQPGTETWGYGIDHQDLIKVLKKHFQTVTWHDMTDPLHTRRAHFADLDSLRYSFVAHK